MDKPLQDRKLKHILLIDDEPGVLFALKLFMEAVGYSVKDFAAPVQAIEFLKGSEICDLVICDLRMPDLNGIGVLEETKKIRPSLPFVLMSGHAASEEINKAKALGADGFLAKPFTPEQLHELVSSIQNRST